MMNPRSPASVLLHEVPFLAGRHRRPRLPRSTERSLWLPYVEVDGIEAATERAERAGATVMFGPREGPAGWRSVVSVPDGGELALWQLKA